MSFRQGISFDTDHLTIYHVNRANPFPGKAPILKETQVDTLKLNKNLTMLTDFYEFTMANGYYKKGMGDTIAYDNGDHFVPPIHSIANISSPILRNTLFTSP